MAVEYEWPDFEDSSQARLAHRPLLVAEWTWAIVREALATPRDDGGLDVDRAVEMIARQERIEQLPRVKESTLWRGCQVLADVGRGMMPFERDRWHLVETIRAVVGQERVEVLYFDGLPLHGVETEPDLDLIQYQPPVRGTPIILLTDLGIADPDFSLRRAAAHEWLEFSQQTKAAGCPLMALVPYPSSRWASQLLDAFAIMQWDLCTTSAMVRRTRENN